MPDLLWDDVADLFDTEEWGVLPNGRVPDASVEDRLDPQGEPGRPMLGFDPGLDRVVRLTPAGRGADA
ncbi:hypothetical protein [Streptomyces sp. NPDC048606]|uniref:hypothetical protein n=1 Tax=Streptomyces sp. NPDC048606 TaxID=3154726 RepID=UPI00342A5DFE